LAHYVIHATDYPPLARLGLFAARRYAEIAPDVPHAQHMPSHIFTRLGLWQDVAGSNLRSATAARRFEEAQRLAAMWDQTAHALDYLVYAYLQEGRDGEAERIVDEAARATKVFPENSLIADYALAAIPARSALERGRWAEAARLPLRPAPAWRAAEAVTHFARALGAARAGDTATARVETDQLATIESALAAAGGPQTDWSRQVKIQRLAASAWLALASGHGEDAVRLAAEAAELEDVTAKHPVTPGAILPARELQGDLLLELGRPMDALAAHRASLEQAPNRARTLYGAARAAQQGGDGKAAREYYAQLVGLLERGDAKRPEMDAARRFLAAR
jgi:tetratricopeptide (TPR) repeat protein